MKNVMKKISVCFDKEGAKFSSWKPLEQVFGQEFVTCWTCQTVGKILKKLANCSIENFTSNCEKILLELAAK